jgi:hypothetical protein
MGGGNFSGDVKSPGVGYLVESWPFGYLHYRILHWLSCLYQGIFLPQQSHHGAQACILGVAATSSGDGMDTTVEYILFNACGLLRLCPFMSGM